MSSNANTESFPRAMREFPCDAAIALAGNVSDFVPRLAPGIINHPLACITASRLYCSSDETRYAAVEERKIRERQRGLTSNEEERSRTG